VKTCDCGKISAEEIQFLFLGRSERLSRSRISAPSPASLHLAFVVVAIVRALAFAVVAVVRAVSTARSLRARA
jgi:hypothetical protein